MPIDLATVDWLYVGVLAVFVLVASAIGNLLSFSRTGFGAILSALAFAAIFVAWTYYPHGLPLPTTLAGKTPEVTAAPPTAPPPATPQRPRNPVTDITPQAR
jgi:hypothetical protein